MRRRCTHEELLADVAAISSGKVECCGEAGVRVYELDDGVWRVRNQLRNRRTSNDLKIFTPWRAAASTSRVRSGGYIVLCSESRLRVELLRRGLVADGAAADGAAAARGLLTTCCQLPREPGEEEEEEDDPPPLRRPPPPPPPPPPLLLLPPPRRRPAAEEEVVAATEKLQARVRLWLLRRYRFRADSLRDAAARLSRRILRMAKWISPGAAGGRHVASAATASLSAQLEAVLATSKEVDAAIESLRAASRSAAERGSRSG